MKAQPLLPAQLQPGRVEAGVDEAGRGPLAGPVVAAAVILPQGFAHPLLRDSKTLKPPQLKLARTLVHEHAVAWGLGIVGVAEIDRQNILQAAISAMHQAVDLLPIAPEWLVVDGNRFRPHRIPHTCLVRGDAHHAAIAAASILAKTYRDDLMRHLHTHYPAYGWDRNMGYPTAAHRAAIAAQGPTPWHRRSFRLLPAASLFEGE